MTPLPESSNGGQLVTTLGRRPRSSRTAYLIMVMVLGSGMAALSWEVVWQARASLSLGVSALGTALTLAATMGGMSLGALLFGRWLENRRPAKPLLLYAFLELVIGLAGLVLFPGF